MMARLQGFSLSEQKGKLLFAEMGKAKGGIGLVRDVCWQFILLKLTCPLGMYS